MIGHASIRIVKLTIICLLSVAVTSCQNNVDEVSIGAGEVLPGVSDHVVYRNSAGDIYFRHLIPIGAPGDLVDLRLFQGLRPTSQIAEYERVLGPAIERGPEGNTGTFRRYRGQTGTIDRISEVLYECEVSPCVSHSVRTTMEASKLSEYLEPRLRRILPAEGGALEIAREKSGERILIRKVDERQLSVQWFADDGLGDPAS